MTTLGAGDAETDAAAVVSTLCFDSPTQNAFANDIGDDSTHETRKQSLQERQEALTRKLSNRMEPKELMDRGVLLAGYQNVAPTVQARRVELERAKKEDILKRKIENRPEKRELIEKGIVKDSNVDPSLQARQLQLKRWQLQDGLDEKMFIRPGPLELVRDKILEEPAPGVRNDIQTGAMPIRKTSESPLRRRSSYMRAEKRPKSDADDDVDMSETMDERLVEVNQSLSRQRRTGLTTAPDQADLFGTDAGDNGLLEMDSPDINIEDFVMNANPVLMDFTPQALDAELMQLNGDSVGADGLSSTTASSVMGLLSPQSVESGSSMKSPSMMTCVSDETASSKPSTPSTPIAYMTSDLGQSQPQFQSHPITQTHQQTASAVGKAERRTPGASASATVAAASGTSAGSSSPRSTKKKRIKNNRGKLKFHIFQPQQLQQNSSKTASVATSFAFASTTPTTPTFLKAVKSTEQVQNSPYDILLKQQQLYLHLQILYEQNLKAHKDRVAKDGLTGEATTSQQQQNQQQLNQQLSMSQLTLQHAAANSYVLSQQNASGGGRSKDGTSAESTALIPPPPPPMPLSLSFGGEGAPAVDEQQLDFYQKQLDALNVEQLKVECKKRELFVSGRKKELIARLLPYAGSIIRGIPTSAALKGRTNSLPVSTEPFFPPLASSDKTANELSLPLDALLQTSSSQASTPALTTPTQQGQPFMASLLTQAVQMQQQQQFETSYMNTPINLTALAEPTPLQPQPQPQEPSVPISALPHRDTAPTTLNLFGTSRTLPRVAAAAAAATHKSSSMPNSPVEPPMLHRVLNKMATQHLPTSTSAGLTNSSLVHDSTLWNSSSPNAAESPPASSTHVLNHFPVSSSSGLEMTGAGSNTFGAYGSPPTSSPFLRSSPPIMLDSVAIRSPNETPLLAEQGSAYDFSGSPQWQMHSDSPGMLPQGGQSPILGTPPIRSNSFHRPHRHGHGGSHRHRAYTYDGSGISLGYQSSPSILGLDENLHPCGRLPFSATPGVASKTSSIDYLDIQQSPSTAAMFGLADCAAGQLAGGGGGGGSNPQFGGSANDFPGVENGAVIGGDAFGSATLPVSTQQDLMFSLDADSGVRTQTDLGGDVFASNGVMPDYLAAAAAANHYGTTQSHEWRHSWPRVPRLQ